MTTLSAMPPINDLIQIAQLASIIISVVGGYFYIRFKLSELDKKICQMEADQKEKSIAINASKTTMKNELNQRIDEKINDMKERHKSDIDVITKRLDRIDAGIDELKVILMKRN
jgi:hypothetical protein